MLNIQSCDVTFLYCINPSYCVSCYLLQLCSVLCLHVFVYCDSLFLSELFLIHWVKISIFSSQIFFIYHSETVRWCRCLKSFVRSACLMLNAFWVNLLKHVTIFFCYSYLKFVSGIWNTIFDLRKGHEMVANFHTSIFLYFARFSGILVCTCVE